MLFHASFDEAYSSRQTNAEVTIADYGTLRESWSGYALQRAGSFVPPFVVPAVDATGHTNVASDASGGVLRFWLTPYWSSESVGGKGPGTPARLVELVAADGKEAVVVWSLQLTADGSALLLFGGSDGDPAVLLRAGLAWPADLWHLVGLNYGPKGTALFVDGQLVAEGAGTLAVPPKVAALVVGSTLAGTDPAGGEFEELFVFGRPLRETAFHYDTWRGQVALGPLGTPEEDAAKRETLAKQAQEAAVERLAVETTEDAGKLPMLLEDNPPATAYSYPANSFWL